MRLSPARLPLECLPPFSRLPAGQHVTVARAVVYAITASAVTVSLKKPLRRGLLLPAEIASGLSTTQPTQAAAQQGGSNGSGSGPAPMAVDSGSGSDGTAFDSSVR